MLKKLFILFAILSISAVQGVLYQVQDIGLLGNEISFPICCNDQGDVAGYVKKNKETSIYYWSAASGLVIVKGIPNPEYETTIKDMNNGGEITGTFWSYDGWWSPAWIQHAFTWSLKGGFRDLGSVNYESAKVIGINNQGHVLVADQQNQIFLSKKGKYSPIPSANNLLTFSENVPVIVMSKSGLIAFTKMVHGVNPFQVVLLDSNTGEEKILFETQAKIFLEAVNDLGDVVGMVNSTGFILTEGSLNLIDDLRPIAINNSRVVLGVIDVSESEDVPALYKDGDLIRFDQLMLPQEAQPFGFSLVGIVLDLNNKGQFVGSVIHWVQYNSVMFNPIEETPAEIPAATEG